MRFSWMYTVTLATSLTITACAKGSAPQITDLPDEEGTEQTAHDIITPEISARGLAVRTLGWTEPTYTPDEEDEILELYQYMDPDDEIPENLRKKALLYFHRNQELIPVKKYLLIVDFSKHSRKYRLFMMNMLTGAVGTMRTSHGKGSDVNNDGYAESFSNVPESNQSTLGFFLTGESYIGKNGYSLRIDGLSATNSMARDRAIVIHGGDYVKEQPIKQGRSLGCFVLAWENRKYVIDRVKDGVLLYAGRSRVD